MIIYGRRYGRPFMIFSAAYVPPVMALGQSLVPPGMRAQMAAITLTFAYVFGTALGPLAVGVGSDLLSPLGEARALAYALSLTALSSLVAAYCFWRTYVVLKGTSRIMH